MRIKPVANSGTLPLICECITSVHIGCLAVRSKLQKGLDSYQEEDLTVLRDRWSKALARRKQYLDEQIQKLINKPGKQPCLVLPVMLFLALFCLSCFSLPCFACHAFPCLVLPVMLFLALFCLSCFSLPCPAVLFLSFLVLLCRVLFCCAFSCLPLSCLVSSFLALSCLILSCFTLSCLSPSLAWSCLALSHPQTLRGFRPQNTFTASTHSCLVLKSALFSDSTHGLLPQTSNGLYSDAFYFDANPLIREREERSNDFIFYFLFHAQQWRG